jgi:TfoX/Sxy family transcriptional regulator of competence genes
MAYDEQLAIRVRKLLKDHRGLLEKKMFGGLAYLSNGKMFAGILNKDLVVRVGPEANEAALKELHTRPMDFTGKPMKGYIYVSPNGVNTPALLRKWLVRGLTFVASLPTTKRKVARRTPKPITYQLNQGGSHHDGHGHRERSGSAV